MRFFELFHALDYEVGVQIALSVVLGGLIGLERELRGRPAGLRTMMLVCLGSTMIMVVSGKLSELQAGQLNEAIVRVDPGRIAAGIVTGVGFLGAGVVIKLGDLVRGVTTAATIWFVAALGIVLGQGHYTLAVVVTGAALVVLWLVGFLEKRLHGSVYRSIDVLVDAAQSERLMVAAHKLFVELRMRVMEVTVTDDNAEAQTKLVFYVRTNRPQLSHETVKRLSANDGVQSVRWH